MIYRKCIKRLLDIIFSVIFFICLLPIILLCCLFVKTTSKGEVFYLQKRVGINKEIFTIIKFRTMLKAADKEQKLGVEVNLNDARITTVGEVLRRLKIDETMQLINVIKGDMSFIGPRPTLPEYLDIYDEWEMNRFRVRPGLSGLAQVKGNIYLSRQQKSYYDVEYIKQIGFITDIKILIRTLGVVILGEERFLEIPKDSEQQTAIVEPKTDSSEGGRI